MERTVIRKSLAAALVGIAAAAPAAAAEVSLNAVMTPKEQIRLDFADGSKHFVLMVRREGKAQGNGPLDGAAVTEYGFHDLVPGQSGDPRGYLVFARPDGGTAYVKWQVRAVFIPGADGKPKLLDNGFWEIAGTSGSLKGRKGAGTLHIKAVSPADRQFELTGEIAQGASR